MNAPETLPRAAFAPADPGAPWTPLRWHALERRPVLAVAVTLLLVAAIGVADDRTGYEFRLGILYLLPIALGTWTQGRSLGLAVALLGPVIWLVTFDTEHRYSQNAYFYWEAVLMAATFGLFAELLARLRAALAIADERFVRVLDGLTAAVYVADDDGRVLFANRRLLQMLGPDAQLRDASPIAARFITTAGDGPRGNDAGPHLPFTGEARDRVDGRWYVIQAGNIPWIGRRTVRLTLMTDVSEQKRAQAMQREHQATMHHTARLVGLAETAASLAHELNQPLLAIVGYNSACLRLLKQGRFDSGDLLEAMEKCRVQAVRAGDIIHRVRELARRRTPALAPCDINAVVRRALGWSVDGAERAGVKVVASYADGLPPVSADAVLLEQVVVNLVQNAIDAMRATPAGMRRVDVATSSEATGGVRVAVQDHGPGIDAEIEDKLYAPFVSTKPEGLGLGLSICRSIVELHGGRIGHTPGDGGGARFHFTLPEEQP